LAPGFAIPGKIAGVAGAIRETQSLKTAAEATEPTVVELNALFASKLEENFTRLSENSTLSIQGWLKPREYQLALRAARGETNPSLPRAMFGTALERMQARSLQIDPRTAPFFQYLAGKNNPDFVGRGLLQGLFFDVTTEARAAKHYLRPYGENLVVHSYKF
jgi:hypothetical protein